MIVNGHNVPLERLPEPSLLALFSLYSLRPEGVAVERNGEIPPRESWTTIRLEDSDRIELIKFVGGG